MMKIDKGKKVGVLSWIENYQINAKWTIGRDTCYRWIELKPGNKINFFLHEEKEWENILKTI